MNALRREYAPILAILLLAFALRTIALETRPLWYDETFSSLLAERGPAEIATGTAADTMPPGYYLLLYGWMKATGETTFGMRMLSVLQSLLVIAFVYAIALRGFGRRTGIWAALLVALMPFQIYYAQELRMYMLLALGVAIYLYGMLGLALTHGTRPAWRDLICIAVGTTLALYAHNLAFVSLVAGNVYFGIQALRRKQTWRAELLLIGAQFVGLLAFTPWLAFVPTQLEKIQRAFWTQPPALVDIVQLLTQFTTYLPLPSILIAAALFVSVLVPVLMGWQLFKLARRQKLNGLGLLLTFALAPPFLLFVLSYLIRPVFVPRGVIGSALVYAILIAIVVARASRTVQFAIGGIALVLAGLWLPFYFSAYGEWRRAPYPQADAYLEANWKPGDVILHDNKLSFFPMHWYATQLPQMFLADPPGSDNDTLAPGSEQAMQLYPSDFGAAVATHPRVWFVIYQTALDEAAALNQPHPNLARLDTELHRLEETDYGDLRIFLYAAP